MNTMAEDTNKPLVYISAGAQKVVTDDILRLTHPEAGRVIAITRSDLEKAYGSKLPHSSELNEKSPETARIKTALDKIVDKMDIPANEKEKAAESLHDPDFIDRVLNNSPAALFPKDRSSYCAVIINDQPFGAKEMFNRMAYLPPNYSLTQSLPEKSGLGFLWGHETTHCAQDYNKLASPDSHLAFEHEADKHGMDVAPELGAIIADARAIGSLHVAMHRIKDDHQTALYNQFEGKITPDQAKDAYSELAREVARSEIMQKGLTGPMEKYYLLNAMQEQAMADQKEGRKEQADALWQVYNKNKDDLLEGRVAAEDVLKSVPKAVRGPDGVDGRLLDVAASFIYPTHVPSQPGKTIPPLVKDALVRLKSQGIGDDDPTVVAGKLYLEAAERRFSEGSDNPSTEPKPFKLPSSGNNSKPSL